MTNAQIIVQKYGGSSLSSSDNIKAVAQAIKASLNRHHKICVVVSAMGHTTNDLLSLAMTVSPAPNKRELDMLVSVGERSSMALLAIALDAFQVKAISLTGSQSGIITDDNHRAASIVAVRPARVFEAFLEHDVVIVAGFQGVSTKREITTLKRGGSDTTAIALAAALNATCAEIYTDVPGVFDGDPKVMEHAQVIDELNFDVACGMTFYGARVLAHEALELARSMNIAVDIKKSCTELSGTRIADTEVKIAKTRTVLSITHLRGVARVELAINELALIHEQAQYFLCAHQKADRYVAYVSNDISQEFLSSQSAHGGMALVTLHLGSSANLLPVLADLAPLLQGNDGRVMDAIFGGGKVFLVVSDSHLADMLQRLSELFLRGSL